MRPKPDKEDRTYTLHNRIQLVYGGEAYFRLLEDLIDRARQVIHLQMYIFDDDETGTRIAHALERAVNRKVLVYFMADGYASQLMSMGFVHRLKTAGIHFRYFEPLFRSRHFYFGRRMHHKVVAIDAAFAMVGGVNIANRYNDFPGRPAWMDTALFIEGEAALQVSRICEATWNKEFRRKTVFPTPYMPASSAMDETPFCAVRVSQNDWVNGKQEIWHTYFNLFITAHKSITIMCSYFLPGRVFRKELTKAIKRGVRIKVILAGPSDVMLAKYAERHLYNWMLKSGIEIYEYQPTVLHAKLAVIDEHWVTVGSFNINNISTYASKELNCDIRNRPFAQNVQHQLDNIIASYCIRIKKENSNLEAPNVQHFIQKMSYQLVRLILFLFTFYFKQEE